RGAGATETRRDNRADCRCGNRPAAEMDRSPWFCRNRTHAAVSRLRLPAWAWFELLVLRDEETLRLPPSGLHELQVERDGDIFADEDTARLESGIPGEAEIFAIDFCYSGEPDSRVAPRVFALRRGPFRFESDWARDAMNGKLPGDLQLIVASPLDAARTERQSGKLFHIEEVRALEVRVALRFACVNRGRVDGSFHARVLDVGRVQSQYAGESGKVSLHVGNHHVFHLELGGGVDRVEVPGCGG